MAKVMVFTTEKEFVDWLFSLPMDQLLKFSTKCNSALNQAQKERNQQKSPTAEEVTKLENEIHKLKMCKTTISLVLRCRTDK